jgi:hypothetical protein
MSDAGLTALVAALGVPIVGAAAGAVFSSFTRRRDDQARRTGERIGALEKALDFDRGRQAGLREAREEASRKGHGQ